MIAHLSGTLLFASDRFIVVEVGGVGYKVRVALDTLRTLRENTKKEVSLWIHTSVREDALDLYIQAKNKRRGDALLDKYMAKIEQWSK